MRSLNPGLNKLLHPHVGQTSGRFTLQLVFCLAIAIASAAFALDSRESNAGIDNSYSSSRILKERDCFAGIFNDHDAWIDALSMGKGGDREVYEDRYPRSEYDTYKENLDCSFFLYNVGKLTVEGYYVKPKDTGNDRLPVMIYNRGGNAQFGKMNFGALFARAFPIASSGFVVVGSQYRGAGIPASEGNNGQDEFGGEDVNDVMALFDIIDNWNFVNSDAIGMLGWSRGGIMGFLVAARTDRLSALVVGGTPTNLQRELLVRSEMEKVFRARIPRYDEDKQSILKSRSAYFWPARIESSLPILMLHGAADDKVTAAGILHMALKLQSMSHPFSLVVYESGSHGLLEYRDAVNRQIVEWFDTHLKDVN